MTATGPAAQPPDRQVLVPAQLPEPQFTRWQLWLAVDRNRVGAASYPSILAAIVVIAFTDDQWSDLSGVNLSGVIVVALAFFLAWTITLTVTLVLLTTAVFGQLDARSLRILLTRTDGRQTWVTRILSSEESGLNWSWQAAAFSVLAIIALLTLSDRDPWLLVLTVAGVAAGWCQMVISYAVNYARENSRAGGLQFPGDSSITFSDYLYQAITVAASVSTSDAVITTRRMRSLTAGNSVVALIFNTAVVAMLVTLLMSNVG